MFLQENISFRNVSEIRVSCIDILGLLSYLFYLFSSRNIRALLKEYPKTRRKVGHNITKRLREL